MPAAACGGDGGIFPAADGAARCDRSGGAAGPCGLSGNPDRAALSRDPYQHRAAGGCDHRRDADRGDDRWNVPATASFPWSRRSDCDADLSAGVSRRGSRLPDYSPRRTTGPDRRFLQSAVWREAGLRLFDLRPVSRLFVFLHSARHSHHHGRGTEARYRPGRSRAFARRGPVGGATRCRPADAGARLRCLRRDCLCDRDGSVRNGVYAGDEHRCTADADLYRIHAGCEFLHLGRAVGRAWRYHLAHSCACLIFTAQLIFTLLVAAFLVVPAILSISAGVTVNYFRGIQSGVTLQWVVQVWELYAGTILLSFVVAFATLAVTLVVGVPAAYALHVRGGRLSRIVEEIITLPLAIPGLAIALALLLTYGGFGDFRRSWLFILVGHVVFTMPFMVRSVMAVFATVDIKTLDEGAASLGASPWRRFRDVIVPNAVPGILAGSLMVVTLSLGEFNLTWMLHTPLTKTLPIGLADSYASMRLEVASAYTLIFFVMIIPLLVAMQLFAEKEQKR